MSKDEIKCKTWTVLTTSSKSNRLCVIHDVIIYVLIIINTLIMGLNSFARFNSDPGFQSLFYWATIISVNILAFNYLLSLWSCTSLKRFTHPVWGRVAFMLLPMSIIELVIIGVFILFGHEANIIFLLLIKISKVVEYLGEEDDYSPFLILKRSFLNKKEELLITIISSTAMLLICAFAIFYVEGKVQPNKFNDIIPSLGWVFSVLTGAPLYDFVPMTVLGKVLHSMMVILGVVIVGLPVGILTGSFVEEIAESKKRKTLKGNGNILKDAFCQEQKILIRRLVKEKLKLASERKILDLDVAMARLSFSQDELFEAVRASPSLRVRACKQDPKSLYEDNLVMECFPGNEIFGTFINRESRIHVISTQSMGELGIGHYSRLLANALNANYYSNEYFSSANLLPETQINFAISDAYLNVNGEASLQGNKEAAVLGPLLRWRNVLDSYIHEGDLVLYMSVCAPVRKANFHVLVGGKKGQSFDSIEKPTVSNLDAVQTFLKSFQKSIAPLEFTAVGHEESGNTNPKHLIRAIYKAKSADVISISVNKHFLEFETLDNYYKTIRILADDIEQSLVNSVL